MSVSLFKRDSVLCEKKKIDKKILMRFGINLQTFDQRYSLAWTNYCNDLYISYKTNIIKTVFNFLISVEGIFFCDGLRFIILLVIILTFEVSNIILLNKIKIG